MTKKHLRTLAAIFAHPAQSGIVWDDIEALFVNLGGAVKEARGSRVVVSLRGIEAVFHRPHPEKETDKGAVASVRRFLINAGVRP